MTLVKFGILIKQTVCYISEACTVEDTVKQLRTEMTVMSLNVKLSEKRAMNLFKHS